MEQEPKFVQFNEVQIAGLSAQLDSARGAAKKQGREAFIKFFRKWSDFGNMLRTKYPDCQTYRLFHVLAGSSVDEGQCDKYDFPGDDSVEKFINEL